MKQILGLGVLLCRGKLYKILVNEMRSSYHSVLFYFILCCLLNTLCHNIYFVFWARPFGCAECFG
jgi:hypothetical protein